MHMVEPLDLSLLPEHAQQELYDFYLFLQQRYTTNITQPKKQYHDAALEDLLKMAKKQNIKVDSLVNIHDLIKQTHDVVL